MNPEKLSKLKSDPVMVDRALNVAALLNSIPGEDPDREGLEETPWRVAKVISELCWGYEVDPAEVLRDAMFTEDQADTMVMVKDIQFTSLCEHHCMPFFGTISIAYIPRHGKIVGISKLARVAEICSKRLQVQERLGAQIADAITEALDPMGVAVIIKAEHTCMTARGIQKPGTQTITSRIDGLFKLEEKARNELMHLLKY